MARASLSSSYVKKQMGGEDEARARRCCCHMSIVACGGTDEVGEDMGKSIIVCRGTDEGVRTRQGRGTVVTICHRCHLMCGGMDEVARASPLLSCVEEQMRGVRKR